MRPLLFILRKHLKNTLKELAKKPLALIAYFSMALGLIALLFFTFTMPSNTLRHGSPEAFGALVLLAVMIFMYFGVRQGITSGSTFFRSSDVNLVFTAPISPKKVLIYGFIRQLFLTLISLVVIVAQIPNLRNNFPIQKSGVVIILVGMILLFFSMQLIGMLLYSLSSRTKNMRDNLEKALNFLVVLFVVGFLGTLLHKRDLWETAVAYLNNRFFEYIPFIGWCKVMLMAAVQGLGVSFYSSLALTLAALAVMILVLYILRTDYYEDVLAATEYREQMYQAKREGRTGMYPGNTLIRRVSFEYTRNGAMAFFQRQLLEYKKAGLLLVDRNSLLIIGLGIASKYLFSSYNIVTVLYFTIYLLFFFSFQGKWAQELTKPYIYLMPGSSQSKVFYTTLAGILKNGVDGLLLFVVAGYMFKADILTILLCALAYMSFGAVYTYGGVITHKLLGATHSKNLSVFLKMILLLFIIMPGIILSIIASGSLPGAGMLLPYLPYLVLVFYNTLACLVMIHLSKGIFEALEMG